MTFDAQVQTLTQDYIVPKVVDQTLNSNTLALVHLSHGSPWFGEQMKFPVKLSNHTQGGSFDDYSEFKVANENVRQTAYFDPRAYYQSVVIGGIAKSVNNISKTQLLNLVKVEMESASQDMIDGIGTLLHSTGAGNSNKDFLGIGAAYDDGNTVATYGGLSRATYTKWASALYTSIGAWDFTKARTLWNKATLGNLKPKLAACNDTVFSYVEADYTASVDGNYNLIEANRAQLTQKGIAPAGRMGLVGQGGFDVLYYAGTPIARDSKVATGVLEVWNPDFLRWYGVAAAEANPISLASLYHEGNDYKDNAPSSVGFSWTGFVRPSKQYAFIGQILSIGNLISPAPRTGTQGQGITS
jgi:hypothetical protein